MLRNICAYTLLMLFFAFVGLGIARPETADTEAQLLRTIDRMSMPIAPARPKACVLTP